MMDGDLGLLRSAELQIDIEEYVAIYSTGTARIITTSFSTDGCYHATSTPRASDHAIRRGLVIMLYA